MNDDVELKIKIKRREVAHLLDALNHWELVLKQHSQDLRQPEIFRLGERRGWRALRKVYRDIKKQLGVTQ